MLWMYAGCFSTTVDSGPCYNYCSGPFCSLSFLTPQNKILGSIWHDIDDQRVFKILDLKDIEMMFSAYQRQVCNLSLTGRAKGMPTWTSYINDGWWIIYFHMIRSSGGGCANGPFCCVCFYASDWFNRSCSSWNDLLCRSPWTSACCSLFFLNRHVMSQQI